MLRSQLWLWMLMFCALALIDACESRDNAKDGDSTRDGPANDGYVTELAVDDAEGEDASESNAVIDGPTNPAVAFLGDWILTGSSLQQCPIRTLDNNAYAVPVSFFLGSEDADGGEAGLYYDPGLGCSLPMVVSGNAAVLRSAPVLCPPLGSPDEVEFSSVQVTAAGSVLTVVEKATSASTSGEALANG